MHDLRDAPRWHSRAVCWRVGLPLVPLGVIAAAAVSAVAVVVWVLVTVVAVLVARSWNQVTLTATDLVVTERRRPRRIPLSEVAGVSVVRTGTTRVLPVVLLDGGERVPVLGAIELSGSASVLQPRAWEGRADRFARLLAELRGFERLDQPDGGPGGSAG